MITLTPEKWTIINRTNTYRNDNIHYVKDRVQYGKSDHWAFPDDEKGDCEDYAIAKQYDLTQEGIESWLATCWVHPDKQGYHAVCLVDTDYGTYVLDNRFPSVFHFEDCHYHWHKKEQPDETWVKIIT